MFTLFLSEIMLAMFAQAQLYQLFCIGRKMTLAEMNRPYLNIPAKLGTTHELTKMIKV